MQKYHKYTIKEYAELKGVSMSAVYKWVRSKRVESLVQYRENKEIIYVIDNTVQNSVLSDSTVCNTENKLNNPHQETINLLLEKLTTMQTQLIDYAEKAGQVKLLTDSESRTQREYFELRQENEMLKLKLKKYEKNSSSFLGKLLLLLVSEKA